MGRSIFRSKLCAHVVHGQCSQHINRVKPCGLYKCKHSSIINIKSSKGQVEVVAYIYAVSI